MTASKTSKRRFFIIGFGVVVFISVIFIYEQVKIPHLSVPSTSAVKSMQVRPNYFSNPHPYVPGLKLKPTSNNSPQNRAVIAKVLTMLSDAKPITFGPASTVEGPDVILTLTDKKQIDVSIPWLPTKDKQPDGRVLPVSKRSTEYVDVQIDNNGTPKWMRYKSPALNNWIESGWKKDLHWKKQ